MSNSDPNALSDDALFNLVVKADEDLFYQGVDVKRRSVEIPRRLTQQWGIEEVVLFGAGKPPIIDRLQSIFRELYRPEVLAMGGHIGVYMFRDVFVRISIPHVFGTAILRPFEHVELTPAQGLVIQRDPEEMAILIDQFTDVADIEFGSSALTPKFQAQELVVRFLGLSRLQLHAAAAILTGGFDFRGAVQSALLATELALKAGAAALGLDESTIKDQFGHRLAALVKSLARKWPLLDAERILSVIDRQPKYVENRYSPQQPPRRAVGHIVMGAQFIVAEVLRQLSDTRLRSVIQPTPERRYPKLTGQPGTGTPA